MSSLLIGKGDLGGAWDQLEEAEKLDPKDPNIAGLRGWILYLSRDLDGARSDLERAVKLQDGNREIPDFVFQAERKLAHVIVMSRKADKPDLKLYEQASRMQKHSSRLLLARDLTEADRLEEAIKESEKAIDPANQSNSRWTEDEAETDLTLAHLALGDALALNGQNDEAWKQYARADLISPRKYLKPFARRGLQRAYAGDLGGALVDLETAYKDEPWSFHVLSRYGAVIALQATPTSQPGFRDALRFLDEAIERYRYTPDAYAWRGLTRIFADGPGGIDRALQDFRDVHRLEPDFPSPPAMTGAILAWRGDLEAAIAELRKAIEEDPRDSHSLQNLGATLARKGRGAEALRWLTMAHDLNPRDSRTLAFRGAVLALDGKVPEALEDLNKAVQFGPKDSHAHSIRGAVLALQGDVAEAIEEAGRAIDLAPREPWHYVLRGKLREAQGDREAACDYAQARKFRILGEFDDEFGLTGETPKNEQVEVARVPARQEEGPAESNHPSPEVLRQILSKLLLARNREWFNGHYFRRDRAGARFLQ